MKPQHIHGLDEWAQPMRPQRVARPVGRGFRWFVFYLALIAIACIASMFFATRAHAQTSCTTTSATACLGATKTSGESPIATTLIWNVPGANACTASGTAGWSGAVATSGTKNLSGITIPMTLKLDCTAPATAGKMQLKFTKPTQNTDGTALTLLGGYLVEYGTAAGSLTQTLSIPLTSVTAINEPPFDSSYTLDNLAAGTWFAGLKARTSGCFPSTTVTCFESVRSGVVSKTVTTTPGGALPQLSVTIEPFQVPKPPANLTVASDPTAFEIRPNTTGTLVASRIGLVPLGTRCYEDKRVAAGVTYNGVPLELVDFVNWPTAAVLREAWARCGA